jgi:hypothetical protein
MSLIIFILSSILAISTYKLREASKVSLRFEKISEIFSSVNYIFELLRDKKKGSAARRFEASIRLSGIILDHQEKCLESCCFCQAEELYNAKTKSTERADKVTNLKLIMKYFICQRLVVISEKYPANFDYKYILVIFLYQRMHNRIKAISIIDQINKMKLSSQEKVRILSFQKKIYKIQEKENLEYFNFKSFNFLLHIEELFKESVNLAIDIFNKTVQFWQSIINKISIDQNDLNYRGSEIIFLRKSLKSCLKMLKRFDLHKGNLAFYLEVLKRDIFNKKVRINCIDKESLNRGSRKRILKASHDLFGDKFYSLLVEYRTCLVTVGFGKMNVGVITRANEGIFDVFGFKKHDVYGENINILIPQQIAKIHDQLLENAALAGNFFRKSRELISYGVTKNKEPVKLKIILSMSISVDSRVEVTGFISQISTDEEFGYIITDDLGFVEQSSETLSSLFNISVEKIQKRTFYIGCLNISLLENLPVALSIFKNFDENNKYSREFKLKSKFEEDRTLVLSIFEGKEDSEEFEKLMLNLKENRINPSDARHSFNKNSFLFENELKQSRSHISITKLDSIAIRTRLHFESEFYEQQVCHKLLTEFGKCIEEIRKRKANQCPVRFFQSAVKFEFPEPSSKVKLNVFVFRKVISLTSRSSGACKKDFRTGSVDFIISHLKNSPETKKTEQADIYFNNDKESRNIKDQLHQKCPNVSDVSQNPCCKERSEKLVKHFKHIRNTVFIGKLIIGLVILAEIIILIVIRLPFLSGLESFNNEQLNLQTFQFRIINSYNYLISSRIAGISLNFKDNFALEQGEIRTLIRDANLRRNLFNPSLNEVFNCTNLRGEFYETNKGFLVEEYLYESNNYLIDASLFSNFTRSVHKSFFNRFKVNLFPFMTELLEALNKENADKAAKFEFNMRLVLILLVVVAVFTCIFITSSQIRIYVFVKRAYDIFLHIGDPEIRELIAYNEAANNFLKMKILSEISKNSEIQPDNPNLKSQVKNKTMKSWYVKEDISNFKKFVYIFLFALSFTLLTLAYIYFNLWQLYMITSLNKTQNDGSKIADSRITLTSLILNSKDYFINPDVTSLMSQDYKNWLRLRFSFSMSKDERLSFSDPEVSNSYKENFCKHVNSTMGNLNDPCDKVFSEILNNNVETIMNILYSKLQFVFSNETTQKYNFTSWQINELDKVNQYFSTGIENIYDKRKIGFISEMQLTKTLQIVITVIKSLSLIIGTGLYIRIAVRSILTVYKEARSIFKQLVPSGALDQNQPIQVQLYRIGFLAKRKK